MKMSKVSSKRRRDLDSADRNHHMKHSRYLNAQPPPPPPTTVVTMPTMFGAAIMNIPLPPPPGETPPPTTPSPPPPPPPPQASQPMSFQPFMIKQPSYSHPATSQPLVSPLVRMCFTSDSYSMMQQPPPPPIEQPQLPQPGMQLQQPPPPGMPLMADIPPPSLATNIKLASVPPSAMVIAPSTSVSYQQDSIVAGASTMTIIESVSADPSTTVDNSKVETVVSSNSLVINERNYEKPVIYNKRELPKVSEGWGIGSFSRYDIIDQVGEGTYGQVYKAVKKDDGRVVALKKVRLENEREGFPITAIREIKILRQLDHKNVVKLLDIVTDNKNDKPYKKDNGAFYLVFEYVDHDLNGLLDSNIVEFSELQVASLFKQLLLALEHCHNLNFLHRDIKCANILINNKGELKLGDFGLARLYLKDVERLYTNRVITLWYRPPELLLGQERYGVEVDIWSAGCILGELFVKKPIFQGNVEQAQLDIISQYCGSLSPENWPEVVNLPNYKVMRSKTYYSRRIKDKFGFLPSRALDLMDRLLQVNPRKRPSATDALKHSWLVNVDPERVPPPELPTHQDCHEMWSKKMRQQSRNNNSNSSGNNSSRHNTSGGHSSHSSAIGSSNGVKSSSQKSHKR